MNNTRFATVIHILTLLADSDGDLLSSDWIAGSININPVIVRKELGILNDAGFVISKKGKDGGSTLAKSAAEIKISEIYLLIKNSDVLGRKNLNTNPKCPIGKNINEKLDVMVNDINDTILQKLGNVSLADFVMQFAT